VSNPVSSDSFEVTAVEIYDTTLRDGSQREGLSLSVEDKLRIAEKLDELGVAFIEAGWPGANPKDTEFFERAKTELRLSGSTLVAFGSTRRAGVAAEDDVVLNALVSSGVSTVCIVAKSWDYHVLEALRTTLDEAEAMVVDSVEFLRSRGLRVLIDAEHFFDGYKNSPEFALRIARAGARAGAETVVLCDTNGGTLPHEVTTIVADVVEAVGPECKVGLHFHDDSGCAVANVLAGVRAGAAHVQGCLNGYGERTGNANLVTVIPNLSLKMGVATIPADRLDRLTAVAHHVAELVNITMNPQQPYVGQSAFAHKAGLHTSAIARRPDAYEHIRPESVGNKTRFVVSELAGRSTVQLKATELGIELDDAGIGSVLDDLKRLENEGYHFEVADGSLELLFRRAAGWRPDFFELESYRVQTEDRDGVPVMTEATVKLHIDGRRVIATGEGNGPVNALDVALREAIEPAFPALQKVHLTDFRVRVLDTSRATGAITRVLIDSSDGESTWTTIGVSENIIEASWQALRDSVYIALLRA
jgi:2-isopropylmalate synthase